MGAALFGFGVGVAVERGQGWMQLKRAMPAPAGAWIAAKVSMSLLFAAIVVALLSVLGFLFGHVRMPAATWLELAAILVAGALPFCSFGLALGYLAGPNSAPGGRKPDLPADVVRVGSVASGRDAAAGSCRPSLWACLRTTMPRSRLA